MLLTNREFIVQASGLLEETTIAEMRVAIEEECAQIPLEMLLDVCKSISSRYEKCIEQNGNQFEYLM